MIFGRLTSPNNGLTFTLLAINKESKNLYTIMAPARNQLFSKQKNDNKDGYFFSFLPPGEYKITTIRYQNVSYVGSVQTDMSFKVAENSAVYLGTISMSWNTTKNYWIAQEGTVEYSVKNESSEAVYRLWKRFPELNRNDLPIVINLISIKNGKIIYDDSTNSKENTTSSDNEPYIYKPLTSQNIGTH